VKHCLRIETVPSGIPKSVILVEENPYFEKYTEFMKLVTA